MNEPEDHHPAVRGVRGGSFWLAPGWLIAAACGGGTAVPPGGDASGDDASGDDASGEVSVPCVGPVEPQLPACEAQHPIAREARTVIDLRDPASVTRGRCDDGTDVGAQFFHAFELPTDPAAYPVIVRIGAAGFDAPCAVCAAAESPPATTYGIGFRARGCAAFDANGACTDGGLDTRLGLRPAVRVTEPWTVGAGGCGEACAWPCTGGYQEFRRTTCLTAYTAAFGVATEAASPPDGEIYIDLIPESLAPCCPFVCP